MTARCGWFPFFGFLPVGGAKPRGPAASCLEPFSIYRRGGGKVGNLLLVFHFSIRLRRRRCGNVGISPAFGEIPKGLVESGGSLRLAFHAFLSPVISIALFSRRHDRQRASIASLAFCMCRAASVSLRAPACRSSILAVIPSFKLFSHSGSDRSFSYGVR